MQEKIFRTEEAYEKLQERKQVLQEILKIKKQNLTGAPEGSVRIVKAGKTNYKCYYRKNGKDKSGEYIKRDDINLVKKLAQKEYDTKIIKKLEMEISAIEKLLQKHSVYNICDNSIIADSKKKFVKPLINDIDEYIDKWKNQPYEKLEAYDIKTELVTKNNEIVRSKSEILIANALYDNGIPYRYEVTIHLGNSVARPDFNVLNTRTRKEYLWEHFGMMDNQEYASKAIKKITDYQNSNYYNGDNVIFTFESSTTPLSPRMIEGIIRKYFV